MDLYALKKKRGASAKVREPLRMIGFSGYIRKMAENLGFDDQDLMRATGIGSRTLNGWKENTTAPQRGIRRLMIQMVDWSDELSAKGFSNEEQRAFMDTPVEVVLKLSPKELFFLNRMELLGQLVGKK